MARVELAIADPANRLTLRAMLEAEGHIVTEAGPEVVITDDYAEALRMAAERPVLVLAAPSQVRDAVTVMRRGVFGYILLPFQPGEAGLMVERALGRRSEPEEEQTLPLEEVESRHIRTVLRRCKGNRAEAARVLGIGRNTLWRKLKKMSDVEPEPAGEEAPSEETEAEPEEAGETRPPL